MSESAICSSSGMAGEEPEEPSETAGGVALDKVARSKKAGFV